MSFWKFNTKVVSYGFCRRYLFQGLHLLSSVISLYIDALYKDFNVTNHLIFHKNVDNFCLHNIIYFKPQLERDYYMYTINWQRRLFNNTVDEFGNQENCWFSPQWFNTFDDVIIDEPFICLLNKGIQHCYTHQGNLYMYKPKFIIKKVYSDPKNCYVLSNLHKLYVFWNFEWFHVQTNVEAIQIMSMNLNLIYVLYCDGLMKSFFKEKNCVTEHQQFKYVFESIQSCKNNVYGCENNKLIAIMDNINGVTNMELSEHEISYYTVGFDHIIFQNSNSKWLSFGNNAQGQCLIKDKLHNIKICEINLNLQKYKILKFEAWYNETLIYYTSI